MKPRRWFRFGLRTMFVLVALSAALTAGFLWYCQKYKTFHTTVPLEVGLTRAEVKSRFGAPERVEISNGEEVWYYYHEIGYVSFKDGKSSSSNGHYMRSPSWLPGPTH